ncbi:hypothetical protein B9G54_05005 [Alloscardovia macacae]|uniref:Uncharacterized protein n=1 Tax=Alloscardovia macacae TaxID=1160091 RepID=A0A1Y2SX90_9BIFI|nr:hypothetical protein B9G54_05005 [Alloscardovia macacae]OTA28410.1 hypothetical protein B9T39_06900 [Alloscardovia macacae]
MAIFEKNKIYGERLPWVHTCMLIGRKVYVRAISRGHFFAELCSEKHGSRKGCDWPVRMVVSERKDECLIFLLGGKREPIIRFYKMPWYRLYECPFLYESFVSMVSGFAWCLSER